MKPWNQSLIIVIFFFFFLEFAVLRLRATSNVSMADQSLNGGVGRRVLMSFKETPHGSNHTFDCSPSGPCVPCQYSEKSEEKFRCSETGYRIPLKCVEINNGIKDESEKKTQNGRSTIEISHNNERPPVVLMGTPLKKDRSLLEDSSTSEGGSQAYITYRSCIPAVNEEKLSVIGFEGVVLCLFLASGSVVYFRKKRTVTMPGVGAGRIQSNSRF